jgi:hypothetical protein
MAVHAEDIGSLCSVLPCDAVVAALCLGSVAFQTVDMATHTVMAAPATLLQLEGDAVEAVMANAENFALVLQPMYKALQVGEHLQQW